MKSKKLKNIYFPGFSDMLLKMATIFWEWNPMEVVRDPAGPAKLGTCW